MFLSSLTMIALFLNEGGPQIERFSDTPKAMVGKDEFTTLEEAEARAEELGCNGTHQHDKDGNTIYMPCSTHAEYEQRLEDNDAD